MSRFTYEPSPAARVGLDAVARTGILGRGAYLDAEIRRVEALIEVRAVVAAIDDPRLKPDEEEVGGVCLSCDGSGWDDGAGEPCFLCGGSGWVGP